MGFIGALNLIYESVALFGAILFWILSVAILIMDRMKLYRNQQGGIQTSWDDFEGEIDSELTSLPDPNEVGLDIPL